MEELPSDTIVEGTQSLDVWRKLTRLTGHFKALMWNEDVKEWQLDDSLGIQVNVEVRRYSQA